MSSPICEGKKLNEPFLQDVRTFVEKIKKLYSKLRTRHVDELRELTRLKKACLVKVEPRAAPSASMNTIIVQDLG